MFYVDTFSGQMVPGHYLGTDEAGRKIYQRVEGFSPIGDDGKPVEFDCDSDGNWLVGPGVDLNHRQEPA